MTSKASKYLCAAVVASLTSSAYAADLEPISYKLTTGAYLLSGGGLPSGPGLDVNLRASGGLIGSGNAWLGLYRSPVQAVKQYRAGWDNTFKFDALRFTPSLQIASGGFFGGSAYLETGSTLFAGAGLGRTNLRSYANLNFDPNDSYTLAGGYRWADNHVLTVQLVRDNRQNPDQQNIHLIYRTPINGSNRLTLDLLSKKGLVAGVPVQRTGLSVGYDWPSFFVRVAYDPLVNFSTQDMLRLSAGARF